MRQPKPFGTKGTRVERSNLSATQAVGFTESGTSERKPTHPETGDEFKIVGVPKTGQTHFTLRKTWSLRHIFVSEEELEAYFVPPTRTYRHLGQVALTLPVVGVFGLVVWVVLRLDSASPVLRIITSIGITIPRLALIFFASLALVATLLWIWVPKRKP